MKKHILFSLLCIFILQRGFSQIEGKICNWNGDKKAAVVLTFDDWSPGQFPIVTPELAQRNINGTFFVIIKTVAAWNHPWSDVMQEVQNGNEIGNHTYTHPDLTTKASDSLEIEIRNAKSIMESNLSPYKVLTFAYPYGAGAGNTAKEIEIRDSIKASGHIAARSVFPPTNYTYNFAVTDDDYYKIQTFTMSGSVTLSSYFAQIQNVINGGGLLTYLYHSVDDATNSHNDTWYNQVKQDQLQKQLDTLIYVKDKVWITTFEQAIKYHRENKCATLSEIQAPANSKWIIDLSDTLNDNIYDQPLSIKLKMNGINYNNITQNGTPLTIDSIYNDTILFHAIPDRGQIILEVSNSTGTTNSILTEQDVTVNPVPSADVVNVTINKPMDNARISISDITGKELYSEEFNGSANLQIHLSGYKKGMYIIKLGQRESFILKKLLVM